MKTSNANTIIQFSITKSFLGNLLVAVSKKGICAILMDDDRNTLINYLEKKFLQHTLIQNNSALKSTVNTITHFIKTPSHLFSLPLDIIGTAFQQRVWKALQKIPVGKTASYTDIAKKINAPTATRAVANACGANPLAIIIPCHRVIRNDGSLSGYRWGIHRKKKLLELEQITSQ